MRIYPFFCYSCRTKKDQRLFEEKQHLIIMIRHLQGRIVTFSAQEDILHIQPQVKVKNVLKYACCGDSVPCWTLNLCLQNGVHVNLLIDIDTSFEYSGSGSCHNLILSINCVLIYILQCVENDYFVHWRFACEKTETLCQYKRASVYYIPNFQSG